MSRGVASATIFSLAAEPPAAFRAEPDSHAEFDAAYLADATTRYPCSIRKLSAAGATLCFDGDVAEGDALCLELANGQRLEGTIAWIEEGEAGFLFDDPIDVIGTLARNLAALPAERRRVPRVELFQTVSVRRGGDVEFTRTRNVSQAGAGIETRLALEAGDAVQVTFDGLRPLDGIVKWAHGGQAGIAFGEELGWQVLMPWLRQVQKHPSHPIRHAIGHEPVGMIPDKHAIRLDVPARVREGPRWWNVTVRGLTAQLVEFETRATLAPGTQLWVALPQIGGAPASVIETRDHLYLCEFRLPLRPRDLGLVSGTGLTRAS
jgi:hypothetical protein